MEFWGGGRARRRPGENDEVTSLNARQSVPAFTRVLWTEGKKKKKRVTNDDSFESSRHRRSITAIAVSSPPTLFVTCSTWALCHSSRGRFRPPDRFFFAFCDYVHQSYLRLEPVLWLCSSHRVTQYFGFIFKCYSILMGKYFGHYGNQLFESCRTSN